LYATLIKANQWISQSRYGRRLQLLLAPFDESVVAELILEKHTSRQVGAFKSVRLREEEPKHGWEESWGVDGRRLYIHEPSGVTQHEKPQEMELEEKEEEERHLQQVAGLSRRSSRLSESIAKMPTPAFLVGHNCL